MQVRRVRTISLSLLAGLILATCLVAGCLRIRRPEVVMIPDNLSGWMVIGYSLQGKPKLQSTGLLSPYLIHMTSQDFETSSPMQNGLAGDKYFWVSPAGKQTALPILDETPTNQAGICGFRYIRSNNANPAEFYAIKAFFVGTHAEFAQSPKDEEYLVNLLE